MAKARSWKVSVMRLAKFRMVFIVGLLGVPTSAVAQSALATDANTELALVNRLTWGANATEMERIRAMGPERWLQAELHPAPGDHLPPRAQAEISALPMLQTPLPDLVRDLAARVADAKAAQASSATPVLPGDASVANAPPGTAPAPAMAPSAMVGAPAADMAPMPAPLTPQQVRNSTLGAAFKEDQARLILRDLYSTDQLREQMAAFWLNHFSVYADKDEIRLSLAQYEDRAIRPYALGRFRDLLEADLRSPAMLRYLDNSQNAAGHINENYAREIMELHTLGLGTGAGAPYTQNDVQELARILTGVGVLNPQALDRDPPHPRPGAIRDGLFTFNPARHDYGDKLFLGHVIKGTGYDEVVQALDILATHPATAAHISRELAEYFVADAPPPALVNRMAARFLESHGDIAAVLDVMAHSPEFAASLRQPLLKDPQHYILSSLRMAYDDRVIVNTGPVVGWLNRLGQPLYGHLTPDGYPPERSAWNGPGQIEQRFEIAQTIGGGAAGLFKGEAQGATALPAFPVLQGALYYSVIADQLGAPTRAALNAATSPQEWNTFFLSSPEFMGR